MDQEEVAQNTLSLSTIQGVHIVEILVSKMSALPQIDELKQTLDRLIREASPLRVLIDMRPVSHVSSGFLGLIASYEARIKLNGGQMVLCTDNPNIQAVLGVMGLTKILTIRPNRSEGLRFFEVDPDQPGQGASESE